MNNKSANTTAIVHDPVQRLNAGQSQLEGSYHRSRTPDAAEFGCQKEPRRGMAGGNILEWRLVVVTWFNLHLVP